MSTDAAMQLIRDAVPKAREILEAAGFVVLTRKSHRALIRRAEHAEAELAVGQAYVETHRRWAEDAFAEQRRLVDRCTFLYGEARTRGATVEDLAGGFA